MVAPEGVSFTKDEIIEQVRFQEQYFNLKNVNFKADCWYYGVL